MTTATELAKTEPTAQYDIMEANADELRALCALSQERRKVVIEYIKGNFTEKVDYGPADPRSTKPTLLKPGAEKICRLFNTRPVWKRDIETYEMLGSPPGVVCFKCEIIDNATGRIIGEGRGAEQVGNKSRDANKAIKAAEKCALVDAALWTFCLSELFTQDLESEARKLAGGDGPDAPTPATMRDKHVLWREVKAYIGAQQLSAPLTPSQLILAAVTVELAKPKIDTMTELQQVRDAIMGGWYDIETGDKLPPFIAAGTPNPDSGKDAPNGTDS